jgi:hypothetical protein
VALPQALHDGAPHVLHARAHGARDAGDVREGAVRAHGARLRSFVSIHARARRGDGDLPQPRHAAPGRVQRGRAAAGAALGDYPRDGAQVCADTGVFVRAGPRAGGAAEAPARRRVPHQIPGGDRQLGV